MKNSNQRKIVLGIVHARFPRGSGGHQCATLHWLIGFRDLGWDVWIVEDVPSAACLDLEGKPCAPAESVNAAAWSEFVRDFGFEGRETLFVDGESEHESELLRFAEGADLFLNYSGQFRRLDLLRSVPCKAYLDVDPGYTQTWARDYECDMNFDGHDHFVTIGSLVGLADCRVPETGHAWIPTVPPVSLPLYASRDLHRLRTAADARLPWTTVAHWYASSEIESAGLTLRPKRDMFHRLVGLGDLLPGRLVVATDLEPDWDDYRRFTASGWKFQPSHGVCRSVETYLDFLSGSAGEIGVAKEGYLTARTGWFSDRSVAYLACGRPVVALDTGWAALLGEAPGLRAFTSAESAAAAISAIERDYAEASRSALDLAQRVFSSRVVLSRLTERLGIDALAGGEASTEPPVAP